MSPSAVIETVSLTYGNSVWKDMLTSYNGQSITYDVYNGQGGVILIVNAAGSVVVKYEYNAWGKVKE